MSTLDADRSAGDPPGVDSVDELHVEGRPNRTVAAALVVALAVVAGWWLLRGDLTAAPERIPVAAATSRPSAPATTETPSDPGAQTIDQLTFLDSDDGVALRLDCSTIDAEGFCPRSLLGTEDAGATWSVRGDLPTFSNGYGRLLVDPSGALAVVDELRMSGLARSLDDGATWERVAVRIGAPAVAPAGTGLVLSLGGCGVELCGLGWIDVPSATLHELPDQPFDGDTESWASWSVGGRTADGLLSVSDPAGNVAISVDGGANWRVTGLPVVVPPDQTLGGSLVRPSGGERIYAFVQLVGSVGLERTYGFRSDDAGLTWTDIGFEGRTVWVPAGVVEGELVTTNLPGGVFLSSGDGTVFSTVPATPRSMFLSQGDPGGVVLGTVFDQQGRSSYWLSRDALGWAPLRLPTG